MRLAAPPPGAGLAVRDEVEEVAFRAPSRSARVDDAGGGEAREGLAEEVDEVDEESEIADPRMSMG